MVNKFKSQHRGETGRQDRVNLDKSPQILAISALALEYSVISGKKWD